MIRNKYTDIVCTIIIVLSLIITVVFMNGEAFGIQKSEYTVGYENRLFNTDVVHTVDIVVDESDWQTMLDEATEEEYIKCNIVIDGESYKNVAIRPKGNSSLTQVAASDSDRYSFKIEFDHYNDSLNYYGLDKLCLNNSVQDNTYMKDFVSYQMMQEVGADGPLCSFAWITVNGQDWGLYLAVEGIEEGFAQRNYGSDYGAIYKPDNMDMNGGKPDMGEMPDLDQMKDQKPDQMPEEETSSQIPEDQSNRAEQNSISNLESQASDQSNWNEQSQAAQGAEIQSDANQNVPSSQAQDNTQASEEAQVPQMAQGRGENGKGSREFDQRGGSMNRGSDAVKLLYSDDEIDSYADIFDNTVMDVTNADKKRLIASIKQLNEGENISEVVDTDEVIRYFVAHNFVLNGDSYTGMMVHNYYLREKVDEYFIQNHYNVDGTKSNIMRVDNEVKYGSSSFYYKLQNYVTSHDMTKKDSYDEVKKMLDVENFIDFWIGEVYTTNNDIVNLRYFNNSELDGGKIKMIFYDFDFAFYNYSLNYLLWILNPEGMGEHHYNNIVLRELMKNSEFKNLFLERLSYNMNNVWTDENVMNRYKELYKILKPEIARNQERWGSTIEKWYNECEVLENYIKKRRDYMLTSIKNYFNLSSKEMEKYFE